MNSETGVREAPEPPTVRSARALFWVPVAVPVLIVALGAALMGGAVAAIARPPASVDSLCASAIEAKLAGRGHTDVEVAPSLRMTEADGARRVSGSVTSVDATGRVDYAELRCVVRGDGPSLRVVSARVSD
ncbi:hypothetical protein [Agromyces sp. NPDC058110]|uniref:hypothetical protein n=1 Tax=Agromyces sp. NPDC058110 TaxID=3346345 RepID=UPI0036DCC772